MWHEARRQERKIRGMLVDYRRRAERRRDFYEKIKADPTQFLQLHGRPCKIHLDSAIAQAADSPATMMPWQGQGDNLIDRFDVRAHLDFIPVLSNKEEDEPSYEERQCHYESYRILAQNIFLGIHEEKFLKQLHLEEQYGYTAEADKEKKRKNTGAAIGFNYDDPTAAKEIIKNNNSSDEDEESDSDLDVDLCIDVSKIEQSQAHEMNKCGQQYGMSTNDFYSFLTNDMEEAENIRLAREEEHEKALFSGRKSRRERRAHREKRLANRVLSPPSYAARDSPTYPAFRESKSRSKSPSPVNTGQITYITSFGEDEEPTASTSKPTYADKVKFGKQRTVVPEKIVVKRPEKPKRKSIDSSDRDRRYRRRSRSRSRSRYYRHRRSRSRSRRSRSRNKSRSVSRSRNKRRGASRSRSRSKKRTRRDSSSSASHSSSSSTSRSSKSSSSRSSSVEAVVKKEEPQKPVQRYYGRKVSDKSSSELEDSPDEEVKSPGSNPATIDKVSFGNSGNAVKPFSTAKMTPQERLKRKMQLLLNKQYKADKIAEQIRSERAQQEQRNREDELREMALKLRRKQRERRHAYDDNSSKSSDSDSSSSSAAGSEARFKRSPTPPSPKRRSSKDEERTRVRERTPPYRSRTEYRSTHRDDRDSTSPPGVKRYHDDSKRTNKYRSLVDY